MKNKRIIKIIGSIDEEAFRKISDELDDLENKPNEKISLYLSSGGGSVYDALAIAGRIRISPCLITITAYGLVASAAVLILAAGDDRRMTRESWVMVHEESGKIKGSVTEMEKETAQLRRMEFQWSDLLHGFTSTPADKWGELHRVTTYLSAQECLDLNLIDRII